MTTQKNRVIFSGMKSILVLIVCLICLVACFPLRNKNFSVETLQISTRTVAEVNLPIHEQWRRGNIFLFNTDADRLYAYGNQLFYVSYEDGGKTRILEALDAKTGVLLWRTEPLPYLPNSLAVDVDTQRLYLALSSKIIVYNSSTGEVLWEDSLLGGRTTYQVIPIGETLLVYSEEDVSSENHEEQVIRKYDSQSGVLKSIDRINLPQKNSSRLLTTPEFDYWSDGKSLWSINNRTSQEQWKIKIDNPVEYNPILTDLNLIFASGIFSDVVAVDNLNGEQIWKYDKKIVSNLAINSNVIYAIREDAVIIAIDILTGEEIGYVNMNPDFTEDNVRSLPFLIATNNNMIFVYYGDSQEIIAFSK